MDLLKNIDYIKNRELIFSVIPNDINKIIISYCSSCYLCHEFAINLCYDCDQIICDECCNECHSCKQKICINESFSCDRCKDCGYYYCKNCTY